MVLGIGKAFRRWKWYRKLSPTIDKWEQLYREGDLKLALGSRKLRMVMGAQIIGTLVAGVMAWLGFDDSLIKTTLDFLSGTLFAGIGGNLWEHTTDTIKTVRKIKAEAAEVIADPNAVK